MFIGIRDRGTEEPGAKISPRTVDISFSSQLVHGLVLVSLIFSMAPLKSLLKISFSPALDISYGPVC